MLTGENIPVGENGAGLILQGTEGSWEEELSRPMQAWEPERLGHGL